MITASVLVACGFSTGSIADESQAEIAKKLNNPIAAMISVPFQFNYDEDLGPTKKGERTLLNIQPVIPIGLNEDWNIISRTILPVIKLQDVPPGNDEDGIGDVTQSLFLSPKALTSNGWTWGAGPALLLRTATDDLLGAEKWAAGPTAVALKQLDGWTYGALVNHLWSYAGNGDATEVDATFLQPFIGYTTSTFTSFFLNTESTYDWVGNDWSVPINFMVSQVFKIGKQPMSLQLGARYWADTPEGAGPEGWGGRLTYTLVLPK
ncbi:MAG: transporter [Halioglobus sp.]|nr:transporter [Halioglobus sp.]